MVHTFKTCKFASVDGGAAIAEHSVVVTGTDTGVIPAGGTISLPATVSPNYPQNSPGFNVAPNSTPTPGLVPVSFYPFTLWSAAGTYIGVKP